MWVTFVQHKKRAFSGSLKRVLILFLCTSLILTLLLILTCMSLYVSIVRSNTAQSVTLYAFEQEKALTDEVQSIRTALYSLANKQEIMDYLNGNEGYKAANAIYINSLLKDLTNYVPLVNDVVLVADDQRLPAMTYNKSEMYNFLRRQELLEKHSASPNSGIAFYTLPAETEYQFLLGIAVPVKGVMQTGEILAMTTAEAIISHLTFARSPFAIFQHDQLVYTNADISAQAEMLQHLHQDRNNQEQWLHFGIRTLDWSVVIQSPLSNEENLFPRDILLWNVILLLIFVLIECCLTWAIHKAIVSPIVSISNQSACINSSSVQIDNPASGRSELNTLVNNINAMVARTNHLSEEYNQARLNLMEMEILHLKERNMFLQAQINPHFLYNMLECICGMATQEKNNSIREMTQLLARMYQYCLRSPESTIGEELECLDWYQKIICLRYREGYRIEVDVPEDLYLLSIPRMVIEPLVENAVQHGFVRSSMQDFFVRISAELIQNLLEIRIMDNGCGMPEEKMRKLNERLYNDSY